MCAFSISLIHFLPLQAAYFYMKLNTFNQPSNYDNLR